MVTRTVYTRITMENEIWKSVVGYEGLYEVSNLGRVKSLERDVDTRWETKAHRKEKMMTPNAHRDGHLRVSLTKAKNPKLFFVHRLVAEAFIPNPENHPLVLHWNDISDQNNVENLRWGTVSDNWNDMVRLGSHRNARKTHCPQNHEYTEENTHRDKLNRRQCRTCGRETRERMKLEVQSDPNHRFHGTPSGYIYGCKCKPCSEVKARNRGSKKK